MWSHSSVFLLLTLAVVGLSQNPPKFSRDDFPSDFVFGAGTSAYQVEGAVAEDGRAPSSWDIFTHEGSQLRDLGTYSMSNGQISSSDCDLMQDHNWRLNTKGRMPDKSTGDVAADGYHKYKEDVKLMSDIGLEGYRFSISWSRLLPDGRGTVNPKGLEYYNNLINELISHGVEPHVTLHHLDFPQILEDEYGGWLCPKIVEDFTYYADVCFREFGDRVSYWTTINEPNIMTISSYDTGQFPPYRCSDPSSISNCTAGNSSVEPYTAMHNVLLAHASAAAVYKEKYQAKQNGWIGLNVYAFWCTPFTNSTTDVKATQRAMDFLIGWVVDPLVFGDYPKIMKKKVGSRLPSFTKFESELIKGSSDFIGLNHYYTIYVTDDTNKPTISPPDYNGDMAIKITVSKDETPSDPSSAPTFALSNPSGLQSLLEYFKNKYGNPPVYVQENGYEAQQNETLNDTARIDFLSGYIGSTLNATRNGSNIRGYFVWSFLDVLELLGGYQARYGLVHVDFEDKELRRQPKLSARWYSNFLKEKSVQIKNIRKAASRSSQ